MRCAEDTLTPAALAMGAPVQWVASCSSLVGGQRHHLVDDLLAERRHPRGRVLSRSKPSTPSAAKPSCQRQTQVLDLPARRMISTVPRPAAEKARSRPRQACF